MCVCVFACVCVWFGLNQTIAFSLFYLCKMNVFFCHFVVAVFFEPVVVWLLYILFFTVILFTFLLCLPTAL